MSLRLLSLLALSGIALAPLSSQTPITPRPKGATELRADSLLRAGNASGAEQLYRQLVQEDSTFLRAWNGLGNAAAAQHRDAVAADAFEHAARGGRIPSAIYNAGAMHSRMGHLDAAFDWLGKAVTAGINQPSQFTGDADLAAVRKDPRFAALLQRATDAFAPCLGDADARRFDFWVGEWSVTPATVPGFDAGSSVVQRVSGGCALLENWTASNGAEGKSLNAFNTALKQWQQYWVGQTGGVIDFRESHWDGPTLVFLARDGMPWQRLSFSPLDSNTVRQFGELSSDSGKTWQVGYDFHYHRKH